MEISTGPGRVSKTKCGRAVCQSVSQWVSVSVCPKTFVNSAGSAKPIRPAEVSKDAPEIGNDDGVCHVAPRVTCDPPRAAA